jgi:hypothetical protein
MEKRMANGTRRSGTQLHQGIQGVRSAGAYAVRCLRREQLCLRERAKIDDLIADSDAAAKPIVGAVAAENSEGKILDREGAAGQSRGWQPAARRRVVGLVQKLRHGLAGSNRFLSPSQ